MADSLLENYNPLYDVHLRQYFALPHMQKHLRRMGLLDSNGVPIAQNGDVESELYVRHHAMMDMMLRNRERVLMQLADLQKKYDAAEKVETYRRVRSGVTDADEFRRTHLSRSLSRPSRPAARAPAAVGGSRERRHSNTFEDTDLIKRIETTFEQAPVPIPKNTYDRLAANAFKYAFLHKLDDSTLINYKESLLNQLQKLRRFRDISFGPHNVARHPPTAQTSWFFRRRSAPSISPTTQEPTRSLLKSIANGLPRQHKSQSPRRHREPQNSSDSPTKARQSPTKRSTTVAAARHKKETRSASPQKPPRPIQRPSPVPAPAYDVLGSAAAAAAAAAGGAVAVAATATITSPREVASPPPTPRDDGDKPVSPSPPPPHDVVNADDAQDYPDSEHDQHPAYAKSEEDAGELVHGDQGNGHFGGTEHGGSAGHQKEPDELDEHDTEHSYYEKTDNDQEHHPQSEEIPPPATELHGEHPEYHESPRHEPADSETHDEHEQLATDESDVHDAEYYEHQAPDDQPADYAASEKSLAHSETDKGSETYDQQGTTFDEPKHESPQQSEPEDESHREKRSYPVLSDDEAIAEESKGFEPAGDDEHHGVVPEDNTRVPVSPHDNANPEDDIVDNAGEDQIQVVQHHFDNAEVRSTDGQDQEHPEDKREPSPKTQPDPEVQDNAGEEACVIRVHTPLGSDADLHSESGRSTDHATTRLEGSEVSAAAEQPPATPEHTLYTDDEADEPSYHQDVMEQSIYAAHDAAGDHDEHHRDQDTPSEHLSARDDGTEREARSDVSSEHHESLPEGHFEHHVKSHVEVHYRTSDGNEHSEHHSEASFEHGHLPEGHEETDEHDAEHDDAPEHPDVHHEYPDTVSEDTGAPDSNAPQESSVADAVPLDSTTASQHGEDEVVNQSEVFEPAVNALTAALRSAKDKAHDFIEAVGDAVEDVLEGHDDFGSPQNEIASGPHSPASSHVESVISATLHPFEANETERDEHEDNNNGSVETDIHKAAGSDTDDHTRADNEATGGELASEPEQHSPVGMGHRPVEAVQESIYEVRSAAEQLGGAIGDIAHEAAEHVKDTASEGRHEAQSAVDDASEGLRSAADVLGAALEHHVDQVAEKVQDAIDNIQQTVLSGVQGDDQGAVEGEHAGLDAHAEHAEDVVDSSVADAEELLEHSRDADLEHGSDVADGAKGVAEEHPDAHVESASPAVSDVVEKSEDVARDVLQSASGVFDSLQSAAEDIQAGFHGLQEDLKNIVDSAGHDAQDIAESVASSCRNVLDSASQGIQDSIDHTAAVLAYENEGTVSGAAEDTEPKKHVIESSVVIDGHDAVFGTENDATGTLTPPVGIRVTTASVTSAGDDDEE